MGRAASFAVVVTVAIASRAHAAATTTLTVDAPFSAIAEGAFPTVPIPDAGSVLPVANLPDGFSFRGMDPEHVRTLLASPTSSSAFFSIDAPKSGFFGNFSPAPSGASVTGHDIRLHCAKFGLRQGALLDELSMDEAGVATLDVHQVWLDTKACSFAFVGSQKLVLKPLAVFDGAPVAYAVRKGDDLTVLLPPGNGIAVSAENDRLTVLRGGAFERVTLPVHRGMATTIVTQVPGLHEWSEVAHGRPGQGRQQVTTIGVDITQTSSDAAPLIVVHAKVNP